VVQVAEQIAEAQASAESSGCTSFDFSQDEAEAASLWQARRIVLWIMMALERHPHEKSINADTDVPMGFGSNTRHLKVLMSFS
jgi:hypothetical protein